MVPPDGVNHDAFALVCLILLEEKVFKRDEEGELIRTGPRPYAGRWKPGSGPTGWLHRRDHGAVTEGEAGILPKLPLRLLQDVDVVPSAVHPKTGSLA